MKAQLIAAAQRAGHQALVARLNAYMLKATREGKVNTSWINPDEPYERAVERFRPYDRVQAPREDMRRDLVRLVRQITEQGADAFVLVNNRAEGCAPLTIRALAKELGIPVREEGPPRSLFD